MKFSKLYSSEKSQWQPHVNQGQLVWPFFASHSVARQQLLKRVSKGEAWWGQAADCELFFSFSKTEEALIVDNLIVIRCRSQKQLIAVLEQAARYFFKKNITPCFVENTITFQKDFFKEMGFQATEQGFTKKVEAKIALVFGGGGSHGAYQIGVWLALQESGVPIDLVTGTSVGALNGALFAQGDLAAAKTLWQKMSTDNVLVFPKASERAEDLPSLISQIGSLTASAIKNRGVSAEPLRKILEELYDEEKMRQTKIDFYFVTTALNGMREKVISYQPEFQKNWITWLLASSAFFPAMALQEVDGNYYMDGGYRNNIPVDIAYQKGATDCFVVDVKGPGFTKLVRQPAGVNVFALHSQWSLGSFLFFSPERSQSNLTLGYLETRKSLGCLQGNWYSFDLDSDLESEWLQFYQEFSEMLADKLLPRHEILNRLRRFYHDRVVWEESGRTMLELAARYLKVAPTEIYDYAELKNKIIMQLNGQRNQLYQELSISEWLAKFYQETSPFSDEEQLTRLLIAAQQNSADIASIIKEAYKRNPLSAMLVAYLIYLQKGSNKWQKNFPTKS